MFRTEGLAHRCYALASIVVLCMLCLVVPSGTSLSDEPVQPSTALTSEPPVGILIPLSGELAAIGAQLRNGIRLAAEETKYEGELIFEDSAVSKAELLTAFRRLESEENVDFIIGPFGPDQTLLVSDNLVAQSTLLVSVAMCEPRFEALRNVFCLFPKASVQIAPLLQLLDDPSVHTIAYLGEELLGLEVYRDALVRKTISAKKTLSINETFEPGATDFRATLTKMKSSPVDILVVAGMSLSSMRSAFSQAQQLGLWPATRWYLGEHDSVFLKENASLLEGSYGLAVPRIATDFEERFQKRFGRGPSLYSALAYDGALTLFTALQSEPDDIDAVSLRMIQARLPHPATVGFSFDDRRAVAAPVVPTRISHGQAVPLAGSK